MQLDLFSAQSTRAAEPPALASPEVEAEARAEAPGAVALPVVAPSAIQGATLADVIAALSDAACLLERAPNLRSAVRTFARVVGLPPDQIASDPAQLQGLIADARPAVAGVKHRNWIQVKSGLRTALKYFGERVMPGRDQGALHPTWQTLVDGLPDPRLRTGLSRLLKFMTREGIRPSGVSEALFERYREALIREGLHARPETAYRAAVKLWNKAVSSTPNWPQVVVPVSADPRLYSLPWEAFPKTFLDDLEAFLTTKAKPDWLARDFSPPVRPRTVQGRRKLTRQIASALVLSGFPAENLTSLAVLTDPANARAALRHQLDRNGDEPNTSIEHQARLLLTLAKHWVKEPDDVVEYLQIQVSNLHIRREGMTAKNKARLKQFKIPENEAALLTLPSRVYRRAQGKQTVTSGEAVRLMYALAVQILLFTPIRVENLHRLEMGRHLREVRRGRKRARFLVLEAGETKTKRDYEAPLPAELDGILDAWLTKYRRTIFAPATALLFPNRQGELRNPGAFSAKLSRFIRRETGLEMNTHLFRHFAGQVILNDDDRAIETVRLVLGHTNQRTPLRSYAYLNAARAAQRHQAVVLKKLDRLNSGAKLSRKPRTRRP